VRQASALTHESGHASPQIVNREHSEHNCIVLSRVVCHMYTGGDSMDDRPSCKYLMRLYYIMMH